MAPIFLLMFFVFAKPLFASSSGLPTEINGRKVVGPFRPVQAVPTDENDRRKAEALVNLLKNGNLRTALLQSKVGVSDAYFVLRDKKVQTDGCKACPVRYAFCGHYDQKFRLSEAFADTSLNVSWIVEANASTSLNTCGKFATTFAQTSYLHEPQNECLQAELERPDFFHTQKVTSSTDWFGFENNPRVVMRKKTVIHKPQLDIARVSVVLAGGLAVTFATGFKLWSMYK